MNLSHFVKQRTHTEYLEILVILMNTRIKFVPLTTITTKLVSFPAENSITHKSYNQNAQTYFLCL
jgi:hypothetical protein